MTSFPQGKTHIKTCRSNEGNVQRNKRETLKDLDTSFRQGDLFSLNLKLRMKCSVQALILIMPLLPFSFSFLVISLSLTMWLQRITSRKSCFAWSHSLKNLQQGSIQDLKGKALNSVLSLLVGKKKKHKTNSVCKLSYNWFDIPKIIQKTELRHLFLINNLLRGGWNKLI